MMKYYLRIGAHSSLYLQWSLRILMGFLLLTGVAGISGCATTHLYNKENDATALAAKTAGDEINFSETITQERANLAQLLTNELEIVNQFSVTRRNTELRALLEDKIDAGGSQGMEPLSKKLKRFTNDRLMILAGKNDYRDMLDHADDIMGNREKVDQEVYKFQSLLSVSAPECAGGLGVPEFVVTADMKKKYKKAKPAGPNSVDIDGLLSKFKTQCNKYQTAWKALNNSAGVLNKIADSERKARKILEDEETAAKDAKDAYEATLKKFNVALKNASEDTKKKIKEKAEAIQDKLVLLAKAGGAFGELGAVDAKIKQIDLILEAVGQGKVEDGKIENASDETKRAVAMFAQFQHFAGGLSTIDALSNLPHVTALLFEKERLLVLKENAERKISRSKERITLLNQKRKSIISEVQALVDSAQHLRWALKANTDNPITKEDLYKNPIEESARRHMVMALAFYLNTFTGPRHLAHQADYRMIDLDHAQALDASETALKLWDVAIKQPVNVLATYHGSGIKQEDIFELLKAAGLFTIAMGVN